MRPEIKVTSDSDLESVFSTDEPIAPKKPTAGKYVCSFPNCGQVFKRMVHLDRHEFKHDGIRKHACDYPDCGKAYTIITHLKRHIKVFHEKNEKNDKTKDIKCSFDFCEKMFCSMYSMGRHIREVHENPKIYKCTHCEEKFTQRIKLRRHEVKHTGVYPYNCEKCSKGFVQEYFMQRHICKSYKCVQCEMKFGKWSELMAHRKASNHNTLYKCDVCNKEYKSKFNFKEHKATHTGEVFKCPHEGCPRFYAYQTSLTQHLLSAHEGRTFPCTVEGCESKFKSKIAQKKHLEAMHMEPQTKKTVKPKTAKPKKQRAKRKDAGKRKQSTLSKLSGVVMEKEVDKMVMEGTAQVEIDLPATEKILEDHTDNDDSDGQHLVVLKVKDF